MGRKLNIVVWISLLITIFCCGQVLAEGRKADTTTVTTVDFRYNNQAPVGYFEVLGVDGKTHIAFCGWHEKKLPQKGWKMTTLDVYTAQNKKNENLRKVLWYGFDGPGNVGANYAQTALAASVALGHMDTDDTGETEGPIGKTFLARVKGMEAPPEEFQVYCVRNLEETEYEHQCLVYYVYNPNGVLKVIKKSSDEKITENNKCYSLKDAVYGVFSDEACENKVGELITNVTGETEEMELKPGTYYLKELKAPQGYRLDEEVKKITISSKEKIEVQFLNEPYVFKVANIVSKYDSEKENKDERNEPQGAASLEGAEYKIDFFAEEFNSIEEIDNKSPAKSWSLKTDANGKIVFDNILPLGTVVIQETKASHGYLLNNEKIVKSLTVEQIVQKGNVMDTIESKEDVIKGNVKIVKFYSEEAQNVPMEGITFVLKSKTNGKEYRITTNKSGEASTVELGGLPYDIYNVSEENTPVGFLSCDSFEVKIEKSGETLSYTIENKVVKGQIVLTKKDAVTGETLEGAEFEVVAAEDIIAPDGSIKAKAGESVDILITNTEGTAASKELSLGEYVVKEIKAPEGYELSEKVYPISIRYVDQETPLVVVDIGDVENELLDVEVEEEKPEESENGIVKTGDVNKGTLYIMLIILSFGMFLTARKLKK